MKERVRIELLLGIVLLVYCNSLWNAFTLDDDLYVTINTQVTNFSVRGLFAPNQYSQVFRPVTVASYALNWALRGGRPFTYHLINLLLHAAVVLLLYVLLRTLLEARSGLEARISQGGTIAYVAALLFAVHPIHTEAVTSIAGRPELLAAGLLMAACLLHLQDREIPALVCFALAVLSKESAVVFLPLVLVMDYARGQWKTPGRYARIGGLTLVYLGVLWKAQGGRFGPPVIPFLDNPLGQISAKWRILNASRVAWKYVGLQIYPRVLSCDYSFAQIPVYFDWRHTLPALLAACLAIAAWVWAIRKNQPGLVLAGGIYLAGFATTSNILVPIGTVMGERLAYLPSAGFCLLVALAWAWLFGKWQQSARQQAVAFGVVAVVLAILGVRTIVRNLDWQNNFTLVSSAVRAVPRSAKMHSNLGGIYSNERRFDVARKEIQTALDIYPVYPDALEAYGLLESRQGHFQEAGWMMEKALYTTPKGTYNYDFMAVNLAALYMQTDHVDGALKILNTEIETSPKFGRAWSNRAVIHYVHGEKDAARSDAETALRLEPGNLQAVAVLQRLASGIPPK